MNFEPDDDEIPFGLTTEELKNRFLCHGCVGEKYLSAEIKRDGRRHQCSYCGRRRAAYSIGDMAQRIGTVFDEHYVRTSDQPDDWQRSLLSDDESDYEWERDGEPVIWAIANAAEIPSAAASDIQEVLEVENAESDHDTLGEETEFSRDSHYKEKEVTNASWRAEWNAFEHSLKTDARFFSRKAQNLLA
jgi:hypothetical protein